MRLLPYGPAAVVQTSKCADRMRKVEVGVRLKILISDLVFGLCYMDGMMSFCPGMYLGFEK